MQEKGRWHSSRILCVISGCGGGDWPPLLGLAEGLHQRGHDLMVVCDTSTVAFVQATGLTTTCLPQDLDLASVFEPALSALLSGDEKLVKGGGNPLEIWGISCADFIQISLFGWCPSLVITSLLGVGLGEALSKILSTPWCFLNPSFNFSHPQNCFRDTDFSEMGLYMYRNWLWPHVKRAHLVLHATDQAFDMCPVVLPVHQKYVGPIFWEMADNSQVAMQIPGPSWVLIALSTSPQPGDMTIVKDALQALDVYGFRVLVTLAPGHDLDNLGPISTNVHVTGYIPHSKVLPHCRFVISHAGHGIVMKSMVYGIPMVLVPWGRDQPGVAVRAERLGAAVVVSRSECSVSSLSEAIRKILNDPVYQERSLAVSRRLRNVDGVAEAVDSIEHFLEKG